MDDSVAQTMSAAEQTLRANTEKILTRVSNGATVQQALRAVGYSRSTITRITAIGQGGHPDVTDEGLRAACTIVMQAADAAAAEVDAALAERWKFLAMVGDDWRAIAEFLKRRDPDEWNPTERTQVEHAGTIGHRSEDAVLAALAAIGGGEEYTDVEPIEDDEPNPDEHEGAA